MADLTPTVYLPVENAGRELDARLLLAAALLPHGLTVIIGQQWLMGGNFRYMPPGVVLVKGMNDMQALAMKHTAALGYAPISMDEEALGIVDPEVIGLGIERSVEGVCRMYFAQAAVHREGITAATGAPADRVRIVGNARLDLLQAPFRSLYQVEADALRAEHGRFVLINTNNGVANSVWGGPEGYARIAAKLKYYVPGNRRHDYLLARETRRDECNMAIMRKTVLALSGACAGVPIVLRPHPSEHAEPWQALCDPLPNVKVVVDDRHISWMLAASVVLHSGCTTGVEAAVLGRPAISVLPEEGQDLALDTLLSNLANPTAIGEAAAVAMVRDALDPGPGVVSAHRIDMIERFCGQLGRPFAFERAAAEILGLLDRVPAGRNAPRWAPSAPERFIKATERDDYKRRKVTLASAPVAARLRELCRLAGINAGFAIEDIGDSLFALHPAA